MEGKKVNLTILLDSTRGHTADDFLIRDLPGTSGRLDVVCRMLIATFRSVPALSPNIRFLSILGGPPKPPLLIQVSNVDSSQVPESELACALILKGLMHTHRTKKLSSHPNWPKFIIKEQGFEETLQKIAKPQNQLLYLVERGTPLDSVSLDLKKPIIVILGDDKGIPPEHEELIQQYQVREVNIGTRSLLGSQIITLLLLDIMRRLQEP